MMRILLTLLGSDGVIKIAIIALVIVVTLFPAVRFLGIKKIKAIVLELIIMAEKEFGNDTGEIKFEVVVGLIYYKMPILSNLISKKTVGSIINSAVEHLKDILMEKPELSERLFNSNRV